MDRWTLLRRVLLAAAPRAALVVAGLGAFYLGEWTALRNLTAALVTAVGNALGLGPLTQSGDMVFEGLAVAWVSPANTYLDLVVCVLPFVTARGGTVRRVAVFLAVPLAIYGVNIARLVLEAGMFRDGVGFRQDNVSPLVVDYAIWLVALAGTYIIWLRRAAAEARRAPAERAGAMRHARAPAIPVLVVAGAFAVAALEDGDHRLLEGEGLAGALLVDELLEYGARLPADVSPPALAGLWRVESDEHGFIFRLDGTPLPVLRQFLVAHFGEPSTDHGPDSFGYRPAVTGVVIAADGENEWIEVICLRDPHAAVRG